MDISFTMTKLYPLLNNSELLDLRKKFRDAGFDIRLVGGCVRDMLMEQEPKDVDMCTDAFPEEMVQILLRSGIRFIETGMQHGTITVVMSQNFEITSLRTEHSHDGRHAVVMYTRD